MFLILGVKRLTDNPFMNKTLQKQLTINQISNDHVSRTVCRSPNSQPLSFTVQFRATNNHSKPSCENLFAQSARILYYFCFKVISTWGPPTDDAPEGSQIARVPNRS